MAKKVVHIISHSHWDREWYMPFEKHRLKLVTLVDECLDLFENEKGFKSFHLDGQTIVLDDYLEIKPEKVDLLIKRIREERFFVGPWYILQDEFLVSGEASVRNLLIGIEEAKRYGKLCEIGYFPDAFGNAGQMPQLLQQAGMKAVIFGRGVKPVGFNNTVAQTGEYESFYSEMRWNSPDGSGLLGILFANWYNNGAEIPVDEKEAKLYWDKKLEDAMCYASTDQLLFMNGCDHQPVQKDIAEAIAVANRLYPDYEFIHSNFHDYIESVIASRKDNLSTVTGELTSQATDGWTTLVNTTSARIYLKQMNRENETALTNLVEPLSVITAESGKEYSYNMIKYAWKMLMQNHPHDSICGCSVDEVHDEMLTRFRKSLQVSEALIEENMAYLGDLIDTSMFIKNHSYPFMVMNTGGNERAGVVSILIDIERAYGELTANHEKMKKLKLNAYCILDQEGNNIPAKVEDMGVRFGYDLPGDKFRRPYMARYVRITFEVKDLPAMGYKVYTLSEGNKKESGKKSLVIDGGMENDYLKVLIHSNGTIDLLHKESGKLLEGICYYEDTGDIGNEYIYRQPEGDIAILSKDYESACRLVEDEDYRATYQITHILQIPKSADATLEDEINNRTDIRLRKARRSTEFVPFTLHTFVSLDKEGRGIKIRTEFENTMKDHRLRLVIPTGINAETHFADSVFEVVERPNRHASTWANPSGCEHQQCYAGIKDTKAGVVVANYGLYEYEILPESDNAIAVTLLRAVGEMGDWGVFLTPKAQCQRSCSTSVEIIPYSVGSKEFDPIIEAYQFQIPILTKQLSIHKGTQPLVRSCLKWEGHGIYLTGMKNKQNSKHRMVRFMNGMSTENVLSIQAESKVMKYYRSNVIEEQLEELIPDGQGIIRVILRPYEIFTIGSILIPDEEASVLDSIPERMVQEDCTGKVQV